jgi:hypothetical protein
METASPSPEEVTRRGREIYERDIRPRVEPEHLGKFLVLDIDSGNYYIAATHVEALKQALAVEPHDALFGMRIGHRAAYRLGGHFRSVSHS